MGLSAGRERPPGSSESEKRCKTVLVGRSSRGFGVGQGFPLEVGVVTDEDLAVGVKFDFVTAALVPERAVPTILRHEAVGQAIGALGTIGFAGDFAVGADQLPQVIDGKAFSNNKVSEAVGA